MKFILAALLALLPAAARAVNCSTMSANGMNFLIPNIGAGGNDFAFCTRYDLMVLGSSVPVSTMTASIVYSNTFAATSTQTFKGALLASNTSFTLTGPNGKIVSASSITASAFFGNGANLTGITGINYTSTNTWYSATDLTGSRSIPTCAAEFATMTWSSQGSRIKFTVNAHAFTADDFVGLNILMDGAYVDAFSSSIYMGYSATTGGSVSATSSIMSSYTTRNVVSAGSHTFCVALRTAGSNSLACTKGCSIKIEDTP